MRHHRNPRMAQRRNLRAHRRAAFQLHRLASGFLQRPAGVLQRLRHRNLIRHERHIEHHQALLAAPHHALRRRNQVIHGHRQRGIVSQHGISVRIPHQNSIHRSVHQPSGGVIVAGQHGNLLTLSLHLLKSQYGSLHYKNILLFSRLLLFS